ncbi:uncharacterized protein LOC130739159 [Lotus japonicus]|uniref:uncharacterized protein LOC130739159 n=1 Tax=Lotus japonicus TaxID=34305 RepID=UPI00258EAE90|nr:uncharacterized protein LOC130739159 [Lotus japonicus]
MAIERELHEDALELKEIVEVLNAAGLMKIVKGLGRCFNNLVREFIVNIPSDCDDESSDEYRKVFVRGKCINFSPEVVNEFLGRSPSVVTEKEPNLNRIANTLTGKLVKKWPTKGLLPSGKLTAKYAVLYKIGTANWMATNHLSGVTPPLARMLYLVGTGGEFDFGKLVFEQTLKHAGSFAVKLPILFPCLLSELMVHQHPDILRSNEPQGKKPLPLKFDYRLFAGTHVPDILLSAAMGTTSAGGSTTPNSNKEDIVAELREISKTLHDTILASKVRKYNVDQLIKTLTNAPGDAEKDTDDAEAADLGVDDDNVEGEEDVMYATTGEEEAKEDNDNEEEDVTGSTGSPTHSASL